MSLKTFLVKIWTGIKALFAKLPVDIKRAVHTGVTIVENIKAFAESPVADILTAIIPGDIDDRIKQILRAELPGLLIRMRLVEDRFKNMGDNMITTAGIAKLVELEGSDKDAALHSLSVNIARAAADGKLTWSDGVYLVEWYYRTQIKPTL